MRIKRFVFLLGVIVFCFLHNSCISLALSVAEIPKYKAYEIPEEFKIKISQECSGHTNFLQADANENGDFALLCYKENNDKENNDVFKKKYVDVYNSDGEFCFEFIFITSMQPAMRMDGNVVYLIFYSNILTFDIATKEINYYDIPGDELWEYTNCEIMQTEEFVVGDWNYKCKRNFLLDFVKLIRFNDNETELLIEMSGAQINDFYGVFFGIAALLIIFIKRKLKIKSKKTKANQCQSCNQTESVFNSYVYNMEELFSDQADDQKTSSGDGI